MRQDLTRQRQHSKRLALLAAAVLATGWALALASAVRPAGVSWRWPFDPAEDGGWQAVSLDGKLVPPTVRYAVGIRDRKVRGGYDGCNSWGFQDENPLSNGDWTIISTLVECPPLPLEDKYRALAFGQPNPTLLGKDALQLEVREHIGIFRRTLGD